MMKKQPNNKGINRRASSSGMHFQLSVKIVRNIDSMNYLSHFPRQNLLSFNRSIRIFGFAYTNPRETLFYIG